MLIRNWKPKDTLSVTALKVIDHIIRNGSDCLQGGTGNHKPGLGSFRLSLCADSFSTSFCLCLQLIILDSSQFEVLPTP